MSTSLSTSSEILKESFNKLVKRKDIADLLEISDYQLRYHLYICPPPKAYKQGQFKFEVQQHLTDRRIPHVASDNQVIFLGGHLLDPLLLLLARV